jgi:hypothetical protein
MLGSDAQSYDEGGFRLLCHTIMSPTANIGKLTIYAGQSPQRELINRQTHPEIKNKIAPTMYDPLPIIATPLVSLASSIT